MTLRVDIQCEEGVLYSAVITHTCTPFIGACPAFLSHPVLLVRPRRPFDQTPPRRSMRWNKHSDLSGQSCLCRCVLSASGGVRRERAGLLEGCSETIALGCGRSQNTPFGQGQEEKGRAQLVGVSLGLINAGEI
jgi:CDGSH-type Zn-finger protein